MLWFQDKKKKFLSQEPETKKSWLQDKNQKFSSPKSETKIKILKS